MWPGQADGELLTSSDPSWVSSVHTTDEELRRFSLGVGAARVQPHVPSDYEAYPRGEVTCEAAFEQLRTVLKEKTKAVFQLAIALS